MTDSNIIKLVVYGKEYTIKTSEDPKQTFAYAEFIDKKMKDTAISSASFDPSRISILVMLQITHELFSLRAKHKDKVNRLLTALDDFEQEIDSAIANYNIEPEPSILITDMSSSLDLEEESLEDLDELESTINLPDDKNLTESDEIQSGDNLESQTNSYELESTLPLEESDQLDKSKKVNQPDDLKLTDELE
ncbi:MAG: cell division protein ZapA [Nitrospinota bacterium]